MWDLPRSGTKHVSPALVGRFFATEAAGKRRSIFFLKTLFLAGLDLHFEWTFSSRFKQGLLFIVVHGLLLMVASLV